MPLSALRRKVGYDPDRTDSWARVDEACDAPRSSNPSNPEKEEGAGAAEAAEAGNGEEGTCAGASDAQAKESVAEVEDAAAPVPKATAKAGAKAKAKKAVESKEKPPAKKPAKKRTKKESGVGEDGSEQKPKKKARKKTTTGADADSEPKPKPKSNPKAKRKREKPPSREELKKQRLEKEGATAAERRRFRNRTKGPDALSQVKGKWSAEESARRAARRLERETQAQNDVTSSMMFAGMVTEATASTRSRFDVKTNAENSRWPWQAERDNAPRNRFSEWKDPFPWNPCLTPDAPDLVLREHHPVNIRRRMMEGGPVKLSGLPNVLYNRWSILDLLIDDMRVLRAEMGYAPMPSAPEVDQRATRVKAFEAFDVATAVGSISEDSPGGRLSVCAYECIQCGNKDPEKFELTCQKDAMVCKTCGVVQRGRVMVAQNRAKNCAEEEDKTIVADRPTVERDRFAQPALSMDEARRERERAVSSTFVPKGAKEKHKLGFAQENVTREAAVAARNRRSMSTYDQTKEQRILIRLEDSMKKLYPMHAEVMKHLRISTYQTWQRAVKHVDVCSDPSRCMLNIKTKTAAIIAESCMVCALERLLQGDVVLDRVEHSHILALNSRLQGEQDISAANVPQRAVRTQVSRLMSHSDSLGVIPPCEAASSRSSSCVPSPLGACAASASAGRPVATNFGGNVGDAGSAPAAAPGSGISEVPAMRRGDSVLTDMDGAETSEILELRNALTEIQSMLPDVKVTIRTAATTALANAPFRKAIFDARNSAPMCVMYEINLKALAYVILAAFAEEAGDREGIEHKTKKRTRLLQSLGLDQRRMDLCTKYVRDIIPDVAFAPSEDDSRDGLF